MTASATSRIYSFEEYLEMEFHSQARHRFDNGIISLMPYTSEQHSLITSNIAGELRQLFKDSQCRSYSSDRMLYVSVCNQTFYPDVMVVCGPSDLYTYKGKMQATLNPIALFEVLSDSTQHLDRTRKWDCYRQISSLRQYILVGQEAMSIEVYSREDDVNRWAIDLYTDPDDFIPIQGVQLPLKEIYRNITFEAAEKNKSDQQEIDPDKNI